MTLQELAAALEWRERMPDDAEWLYAWLAAYLGIHVPHRPVCRGHSSPFRMLAQQFLERPPIALWHGPRGGGKSFLSAVETHLTSRFRAGHGTCILGGSKQQSKQIYNALDYLNREAGGVVGGEEFHDRDQIGPRDLLAESALYRNGSEVSILAASHTSVRGPHVPSLKLDEVDEIDPDIREDALGMAMEMRRRGRVHTASILMTSTWHRSNGPMAGLMQKAAEGAFPAHTFCTFEVLQRCPDDRSGPWVGGEARYLNCPSCKLRPWCHSDCGRNGPEKLPKAKRSGGHYSIDSLIQKVDSASPQTVESDYFSMGPQPKGLWFPNFSHKAGGNVTPEAEYLPGIEVHTPIDSGNHTGGVLFQVETVRDGEYEHERVRVFADYYSVGRGARLAATEFMQVAAQRCESRMDRPTTDPAGKAATAVGPVVLGEYEAVGFRPKPWPSYPGSVRQGLNLIDSFLCTATGRRDLIIHPRCKHLIDAFRHYERKKLRGEYLDEPADPQHPYEDMIDALRGGLHAAYPEGRRPEPRLTRVPARQVF